MLRAASEGDASVTPSGEALTARWRTTSFGTMNRNGRIARIFGVVLFVAAGVVDIWSAPPSLPVRHDDLVSMAPMAMAMPASAPTPRGVSAPEHGPLLPPATQHGLAHRLRQYPAVFLATPKQRAAAERLGPNYSRQRDGGRTRAAAAAGFDLHRGSSGERRASRDVVPLRESLLARHPWGVPRAGTPRHAHLRRPARRPLKLVGAMISMPRGVRGPTPGGPITRWHDHLVCVAGDKRGLAPRGDGSCPTGSKLGVEAR